MPKQKFNHLPVGVRLSFGWLIICSLLGIVAPWIANNPDGIWLPFGPETIDKACLTWQKPGCISESGVAHPFGTTKLGKDVCAGIIHGLRLDLWIGFGAAILSVFISLITGILSGYYYREGIRISKWQSILAGPIVLWLGWLIYIYATESSLATLVLIIVLIIGFALLGRMPIGNRTKVTWPVDATITKLIELRKSTPILIILMIVSAIVLKPSPLFNAAIIGLLSWTTGSRIVRAEVIRLSSSKYVSAAVASGASNLSIMLKHLLPMLTPTLVVIGSFGVSSAILVIATLTFLGLGLSSEYLTWGGMMAEARSNPSAWWLVVFPGLILFSLILSLNVIGSYYANRTLSQRDL